MKKKKIVVTGTRGIPDIMGGVETHCEHLFPRLAEMGYRVSVIRRSAYVKAGVDKRAGVADGVWKGVKLVDLKSPRKKSFEAIIHTVKAVVMARWMGANVLHIHAIGPALVTPLARLLGLKVVFTHHGPDYDRDKWGFAAKTMLKLGERMGCWFANDVIVISDVIRNLIASKYGRTKRVHLIYNGVPEPELCSEPEYFEELGIEPGKYVLGMCRFVPEKNLHHLVEAFCKIRDDFQIKDERLGIKDFPYKLVLAGDTDFEDEYSLGLKKMARENGVVLTGFVKGRKLHSLLTNAACYSLPSSHEGLPISLLEAMSYRLPVVVSDIPANLEVGLTPYDSIKDEDNQLLSPYHKVGDVDALAGRLSAILTCTEERNDSTPLRIDYDMQKYNWDVIAKQVSEVYDGL